MLLTEPLQPPDNQPEERKEKKAAIPPLDLFRKAVRIVLIFYRCCKALRESSRDKTESSFIETRFFAMKAAEEANKVGFNKTEYKRGFGSVIPVSAKETLAKPPLDRTDKEVALLQGLLRTLDGFKQFSNVIQRGLCRTMQYCRYGGNRVIVRKGHEGERFYLVFSGSVFINDSELDKVSGVAIPVTVNILYRGSVFGEYALIKKTPRTATVLSREPVELLFVDREDFTDISNTFELEIQQKMKFVKHIPLFNEWELSDLEDILIQTTAKEFPIGSTIEEDGVTSGWIYVVMEGKCKIFRKLNVKKLKDKVLGERKSAEMNRWVKEHVMPPLCVFRPKPKKSVDSTTKPPSPERRLSRRRSMTAQQSERRWSRMTPVRRITRSIMIDHPEKDEREMTTPETIEVFVGDVKQNDVFDLSPLITKRQDVELKLVSSGAKVLRLPKRKFFLLAKDAQLDAAKKCAIIFRTDDELYDAYCEYNSWQRYRLRVISEEISTQINKGVLRAEKNAEQALERIQLQAMKPLQLPPYFNLDQARREGGGGARRRRVRTSSWHDQTTMSTVSLASTRLQSSMHSLSVSASGHY
ncbi:cyclic nucleotide-binding domain-containing protein 2-like isoform X2 [Oscarella lobularis]